MFIVFLFVFFLCLFLFCRKKFGFLIRFLPFAINFGKILPVPSRQCEIFLWLPTSHVVTINGHISSTDNKIVLSISCGSKSLLHFHTGRWTTTTLITFSLSRWFQFYRAIISWHLFPVFIVTKQSSHLSAFSSTLMTTLLEY